MLDGMADLPLRSGVRPMTSASGQHRQLSQHSHPDIWGRVAAAIFAMDRVVEGRSAVCSSSARAAFLEDVLVPRSAETSLAPITARLEPVHLHGVADTSLHLCLPAARAHEVCALGWGEPHHYAGHETEIMVYGPRDLDELSTVIDIVLESIAFARG